MSYREEIIREFREKVVGGVYYNMPKDYRKSREWTEKTFADKYRTAMAHSTAPSVIEETVAYMCEKASQN